MKDYDEICYEKNFINQVIVRIDFLQYIPNDIIFFDEVEENMIEFFPRQGMNQIIRFNDINVVYDGKNQMTSNTNSSVREGLQKEFATIDGMNKVSLNNKALVFSIGNYISFEEHMKPIKAVVSTLYLKNKIIAARIGVRYINLYESDKIKLQKKLFF